MLRCDVLTLFPEMVMPVLDSSMLKPPKTVVSTANRSVGHMRDKVSFGRSPGAR